MNSLMLLLVMLILPLIGLVMLLAPESVIRYSEWRFVGKESRFYYWLRRGFQVSGLVLLFLWLVIAVVSAFQWR